MSFLVFFFSILVCFDLFFVLDIKFKFFLACECTFCYIIVLLH